MADWMNRQKPFLVASEGRLTDGYQDHGGWNFRLWKFEGWINANILYVHPYLGKMIQFDYYIDGMKPPTGYVFLYSNMANGRSCSSISVPIAWGSYEFWLQGVEVGWCTQRSLKAPPGICKKPCMWIVRKTKPNQLSLNPLQDCKPQQCENRTCFFRYFHHPHFFIGCFPWTIRRSKNCIGIDHNRSQSQCLPLHENADLHGRENLAGYSVWFVATLIPEENRFVSWLTPPNAYYFCGSLYFCFLSLFDWSWGVYAFQWPAKNTRIWIHAEQKEKEVASPGMVTLGTIALWSRWFFPNLPGMVGYGLVCSLEASFFWDVFVLVFFADVTFFELFFLLEVYPNQSVFFSS